MPAEPWQLVIQERGAGRYQMLGAAMAVSHIQGRTLEGIGFGGAAMSRSCSGAGSGRFY
jgi:hypothetical protein